MNFAKIKESVITKSFDYPPVDETGDTDVQPTEKVTFSFYEKCMTPAFFDAMTQFETTKNSCEIAKHLARNITNWDLDWNGEPFPPTFENLSEVCDFDFLMRLVNEMAAVIGGGDKKKRVKSKSLSAVSANSATEAIN